MKNRLEKQMEFLFEIDKLKSIMRQNYLADASRNESDTDHSWHLAIMSFILSEYSNEDVDVLRVMSMVLIHDIIEIDAGDTYAYDEQAALDKRERELKAADRIFNLLPEDQAEYVRELWDEFEANETNEAHFANMLDRIQPTMLNSASDGVSWREHGIGESQIVKRNSVSSMGSKRLWQYALHKFVKPNVRLGNLRYDYENVDYERYELSFYKINELYDDQESIPEEYREYINEMLSAFKAYEKCITWIQGNSYAYGAPMYMWYKNVPVEILKEMNESVNRFRYDKEYYETSFANPTVSVKKFGEELGRMLSYVSSMILSLGSYCYCEGYYEIITLAELFLEIVNIIQTYESNKISGSIKSAIYYHINDYMEEDMEYRVRDTITDKKHFFTDIIKYADIEDERSLYITGENITENEVRSHSHINSLSTEVIDKLAKAYVDGYVRGFKAAGIDLSKKKYVQIRYVTGFERIVLRAIELFENMDLVPVIARNGSLRYNVAVFQSGSIDANPQFAYDHRFDSGIYYNKAINEMKLKALKKAYECYKEEAKLYAGPACIECFGEKEFDPVAKDEATELSEEQKNLSSEYQIKASAIVNEYISREDYSFTIIALPVPDIGKDYEAIFDETVKINTLDTVMYEKVHSEIIKVLDECEYVRILGGNGNKTDLHIALWELNDPEKETKFENCLADVNIPVGEVFTSPKLTGTNGLLHVKEVYINGLMYKDLEIEFNDGMTGRYDLSNYDDKEKNLAFVAGNLMHHHKSLPMGEFAIGTNTLAFAMGKKYGISDKLPILIAEKTGPHIAIGDTCYSMSEEIKVYNPDGKEIIARENEISLLRKQDINKAYFGCHTDITIPYNELALLTAVGKDGNCVDIIKDGQFVLENAKVLNDYFN